MVATAASSSRVTRANRPTFVGDAKSIVIESISKWLRHNASSMGAALAFYTLFAVAPILIIATGVAEAMLSKDTVQTEILAQMRALVGDQGAAGIATLLAGAQLAGKGAMTTALGVCTLLIGSTSVFAELQSCLDRIWGTPERLRGQGLWALLRTRILSFGLILGVGFLLLVSLVASAVLSAIGSWLGTFVAQWQVVLISLDFVLTIIVTTVLFAIVYKFLPRESIAWGDVWVGALVTAGLFSIGKIMIGLYLGHSAFASAYGVAGSFLILLLWVYYSAQIFLLGAEFTCAFAYRSGSRAQHSAARTGRAVERRSVRHRTA
jgi:membrane protein